MLYQSPCVLCLLLHLPFLQPGQQQRRRLCLLRQLLLPVVLHICGIDPHQARQAQQAGNVSQ